MMKLLISNNGANLISTDGSAIVSPDTYSMPALLSLRYSSFALETFILKNKNTIESRF